MADTASSHKGKTLLIGVRGMADVRTGLSTMFEHLIAGMQARSLPFSVVNLKHRSGGPIGSFSLSRTAEIFLAVLKAWIKMVPARNVYLILSISGLGSLRDVLILWPAIKLRKHISVQVRGGGYDVFFARQSALHRRLLRATLARVDHIIVLSQSLRRQFVFSQRLFEKTVVVPNGVEAPRPTASTRPDYPGEGPFNILYLSNMIASKGYLDLLQACRSLVEEGVKDFQCDYCGEFISLAEEVGTNPASDKESFLNAVDAWGLSDNVHYHGSVGSDTKAEFLRKAHVLVLPTNYLWEGQPVCILEALSHGIPVIATPYRAIVDEIQDGFNGLLVEYAAPGQIKEAIQKLKNDPAFYRRLCENAVRVYLETFTIEKHLDSILPLILSSPARASKGREIVQL